MLPIPLFKAEPAVLSNNFIVFDAGGYQSSGTFSRDLLPYWKIRYQTESTTSIDFNLFKNIDLGTSSTFTGAYDNLIGSRWQVSGGQDEYAFEFYSDFEFQPLTSTQSFASIYQVVFDINPLNVSAVSIFTQDDPNPPFSQKSHKISVLQNGATIFNSGIISHSQAFKVIWNKQTGDLTVYSRSPNVNPFYTTLQLSIPSYGTNFSPVSMFQYFPNESSNIDFYFIKMSVSNYLPNGLTGSMFNLTHNPPPTNILLGQNDLY
jgi:hypothetical protein